MPPPAQAVELSSLLSSKVTATLASQLSVAVTLIVVAGGMLAPQAAVISAGTPAKVGPAISCTVIN